MSPIERKVSRASERSNSPAAHRRVHRPQEPMRARERAHLGSRDDLDDFDLDVDLDDPAALLAEFRRLSHRSVELQAALYTVHRDLAAIMRVVGDRLTSNAPPAPMLPPHESRPVPRDLTNIYSVYRVHPDPEGRAHLDRIEPRREFRPLDPESTPEASPGDAPDVADLQILHSPADIHAAARPIFASLDPVREHFVVLLCTADARLQGYRLIASGTANEVLVHARDIIRPAMLLGAAAMVGVHNHPGGNLRPSRADIALTRKLIETGRLADLPLIDNLIISHRGYHSIRRHYPGLFDYP